MKRFTPLAKATAGLAVIAACSGVAVAASALVSPADQSVAKALAERLPKTEITAVDCESIAGVCEVQARQNLFYVDESARYLIIGRVYDMETKQDLTAARLLEMNPDMLVGGGGVGAAPSPKAPAGKQPTIDAKVDPAVLAALPKNGAVTMGRGNHTLTVFSDFRCGYCKQLYETLDAMNVKVVERPISVMGTRPISEAVICASNKRRALGQAYDGGSITGVQTSATDCDTSGLDANEAFAKQHGFNGTPVIVREDGAVVHGYRPRDFLEAWIKESAS